MTDRNHQEVDSSQEDDKYDFKFLFEKIFACYVVPCVHSACILYIMAAATMRLPTSIYTIAIMIFVVCDLLAWAGTTLGLLLSAPSFFETLLQKGMIKKLYVWKGISMAFEILILLMLVLVEVIKKERVVDCICVCAAVFLFSGVLETFFIKYFNKTLQKIKHKMEENGEKRVHHEASSVGYHGNTSQNATDATQPSLPEFIDFDGPSSNPIAPFSPPNSKTRPIEDRHPKNKIPYGNEKLLNDARLYLEPRKPSSPYFSPTGNEAPRVDPPVAPTIPDIRSESPPKPVAPLYSQNETRGVPLDPRPPFGRNPGSPPANFSIESDIHPPNLNTSHLNSDVHYGSSGASLQVPPPLLAFSPPETRFRAPSDHAASDFISESSYNNHRM